MDDYYLNLALNEANKAVDRGEIPVGCVIVKDGRVIAKAYNIKESKKCSTKHAEILAIEKACKKCKSWRLDDCTMYVTLEPCMMCMGAIVESRIKKVYYGTKNNCEQMYDINKIKKNIFVENMNNVQCSRILTDFFKNKRKK